MNGRSERSAPRVDYRVPLEITRLVEAEGGPTEISGRSFDISTGGMGLATDGAPALHAGERIQCRLRLGGMSTTLIGTVAWFGSPSVGNSRGGICFESLAAREHSLVEQAVAAVRAGGSPITLHFLDMGLRLEAQALADRAGVRVRAPFPMLAEGTRVALEQGQGQHLATQGMVTGLQLDRSGPIPVLEFRVGVEDSEHPPPPLPNHAGATEPDIAEQAVALGSSDRPRVESGDASHDTNEAALDSASEDPPTPHPTASDPHHGKTSPAPAAATLPEIKKGSTTVPPAGGPSPEPRMRSTVAITGSTGGPAATRSEPPAGPRLNPSIPPGMRRAEAQASLRKRAQVFAVMLVVGLLCALLWNPIRQLLGTTDQGPKPTPQSSADSLLAPVADPTAAAKNSLGSSSTVASGDAVPDTAPSEIIARSAAPTHTALAGTGPNIQPEATVAVEETRAPATVAPLRELQVIREGSTTRVRVPLVGTVDAMESRLWKDPQAVAVQLPEGRPALQPGRHAVGRAHVSYVQIGAADQPTAIVVALSRPISTYTLHPESGTLEIRLNF